MNVAKEKLKSVESEHGRQVHLRRLINSCVLQGGGEGEVDKIFQAYSPETKTTETDEQRDDHEMTRFFGERNVCVNFLPSLLTHTLAGFDF